jgi:hypothetical protein
MDRAAIAKQLRIIDCKAISQQLRSGRKAIAQSISKEL